MLCAVVCECFHKRMSRARGLVKKFTNVGMMIANHARNMPYLVKVVTIACTGIAIADFVPLEFFHKRARGEIGGIDPNW